jgi:hypothetical protein
MSFKEEKSKRLDITPKSKARPSSELIQTKDSFARQVGGWKQESNALSSGKIRIDSANEKFLIGDSTDPTTGVGIFIGKSGDVYVLRAGDPSGNYIYWDGTDLTINGQMVGGSVSASLLTGLATSRLLGRTTSGAGAVEEITVGTGLTFSSKNLACAITQYTDALARGAISETITGIGYNSSTGVFSLTAGYVIPTTTEQSNWNSAYGWGNHATPGYLLNTSGNALLSSTTAINAKTVATTNLYTVPAGKTAIITGVIFHCTAADTVTVVPTLGVGVAAGEIDIMPSTSLTGFDALNELYRYSPEGTYVSVAAGGVIKVGIDTGATATTMTISAYLMGFLV